MLRKLARKDRCRHMHDHWALCKPEKCNPMASQQLIPPMWEQNRRAVYILHILWDWMTKLASSYLEQHHRKEKVHYKYYWKIFWSQAQDKGYLTLFLSTGDKDQIVFFSSILQIQRTKMADYFEFSKYCLYSSLGKIYLYNSSNGGFWKK